MATRDEIKSLIAKEGYTLTKIAEEMTKISSKNYDVNGLSQKLTRNTLRYEEFKMIVKILGYEIDFKKAK